MSEAFALRLPLVRRFKRPPARLVYAAMVLLLDLLWLAACAMWVAVVAVDVLTPLLCVGWSWFAVRDHRNLRRLLADLCGRSKAGAGEPSGVAVLRRRLHAVAGGRPSGVPVDVSDRRLLCSREATNEWR